MVIFFYQTTITTVEFSCCSCKKGRLDELICCNCSSCFCCIEVIIKNLKQKYIWLSIYFPTEQNHYFELYCILCKYMNDLILQLPLVVVSMIHNYKYIVRKATINFCLMNINKVHQVEKYTKEMFTLKKVNLKYQCLDYILRIHQKYT